MKNIDLLGNKTHTVTNEKYLKFKNSAEKFFLKQNINFELNIIEF